MAFALRHVVAGSLLSLTIVFSAAAQGEVSSGVVSQAPAWIETDLESTETEIKTNAEVEAQPGSHEATVSGSGLAYDLQFGPGDWDETEPLPLVAAEPKVCPQCQTAPGLENQRKCESCCRGSMIDWGLYPATIHPMPRQGYFQLPPTQGRASYSMSDWLSGRKTDAAPKSGYSPTALNSYPFFDADWRYVEGLDPADRTWVERFKRMHLNDCLLLSTGGMYWIRLMDEHNSRLTRVTNDYTLNRLRTYADLWYGDSYRVYGEYLWSDSFGEDLAPTVFDSNRGDIFNLFVDARLFDVGGKGVFVRGGRQEMLYGSQRLLSPLEWANTRRTFEGAKLFRQGDTWDADAFWVRPVITDPTGLDAADPNQDLFGVWTTHRPRKGEAFDLYYVGLSNRNRVTQAGIDRAPIETHTTGSRWVGDREGLLWDFELMTQFGQQLRSDLFAGAATAGLGRCWQDVSLTPTLWAYYDYASGDSDPNAGNAHTFQQLFPFGHYYMGWMDLVGRQNIHDVNLHAYLYPTRWITCWGQYHHYWLDQPKDALYGPGGGVVRRDPTGNAGRNVGDEIGIYTNFHLTRYSDVMISYNQLFGGNFLAATAGPLGAADARSLYLMFQQRW